MTNRSRRKLLAATTTIAGSLAGCTLLPRQSDTNPENTTSDSDAGTPEDDTICEPSTSADSITERLRCRGYQIAGFDEEDMANWEFDGYDAYFELQEETTNPYIGDQSGLIYKTDDPGSRLVWKYDSPKDFGDWGAFSVAIYLKYDFGNTNFDIQLLDVNENLLNYRQSLAPGETDPIEHWYRLDVGSPTVIEDGFDPTQVSKLRIVMGGSGDIDKGLFVLDDLRYVPEGRSGVILEVDNPAHDDDHWMVDGKPLYEIASEYGVTLTLAVSKSHVEKSDIVTIDELKRAQDQGHLIVSKGTRFQTIDDNSLDENGVTDEELESYVAENKRWMIENDLTSGPDFFTYDGNNIGDRALELIKEYHIWGRAANARMHGSLTYPFRKPATNIEGKFDRVQTFIDEAIMTKKIAHLYWHQRNVSGNELQNLFSYIREAKSDEELEIMTPKDCLETEI